MGAYDFIAVGPSGDVETAFFSAREDAASRFGREGYTGTIAEKRDFVVVADGPMSPEAAKECAEQLLESGDERIRDKRGPAGAIPVDDGSWIFVGYASS
ncbi:hypothetical protein ACIOG4_38860 [Streptomyces microflavus]|uniref:hypothetical protein n=1 Tax=Streptomyces microflavus TaxID=1919 RepID=UPI003818CB23